jgi:hypothetical protein
VGADDRALLPNVPVRAAVASRVLRGLGEAVPDARAALRGSLAALRLGAEAAPKGQLLPRELPGEHRPDPLDGGLGLWEFQRGIVRFLTPPSFADPDRDVVGVGDAHQIPLAARLPEGGGSAPGRRR